MLPGHRVRRPHGRRQVLAHQNYDDCVIMSSADVVGQITGKLPSERAIIKVAQSTPSVFHSGSIYLKPADKNDPNSGMGTNPEDLPTLLARYDSAGWTRRGQAAKTGIATGKEALEQYLGDGHAVIVGLNAEMIWNQPIEKGQGRPAASRPRGGRDRRRHRQRRRAPQRQR